MRRPRAVLPLVLGSTPFAAKSTWREIFALGSVGELWFPVMTEYGTILSPNKILVETFTEFEGECGDNDAILPA